MLSRRTIIIGSAIALSLIGGVSALSMRGERTVTIKNEEPKGDQMKAATARSGRRNYVTANSAGSVIVVDKQTAQTRDLTPEEARRLADGIKQLVNQSTEGLVKVQYEDGSISMDLQGHFQNVMLAKKESDGTISKSCVDNPEEAANFFEIDPVLVGAARAAGSRPASTKLEDR